MSSESFKWNGKVASLGDKVVIAAAFAFVFALYFFIWGSGQAYRAEIRVGGQDPLSISLREDQIIKVNGAIGESVIEVKDGAVRFVSSPCDAKICIKSGWLKHAHELAACLPNGVTVHVQGEEVFDAINF